MLEYITLPLLFLAIFYKNQFRLYSKSYKLLTLQIEMYVYILGRKIFYFQFQFLFFLISRQICSYATKYIFY